MYVSRFYSKTLYLDEMWIEMSSVYIKCNLKVLNTRETGVFGLSTANLLEKCI